LGDTLKDALKIKKHKDTELTQAISSEEEFSFDIDSTSMMLPLFTFKLTSLKNPMSDHEVTTGEKQKHYRKSIRNIVKKFFNHNLHRKHLQHLVNGVNHKNLLCGIKVEFNKNDGRVLLCYRIPMIFHYDKL
jgi:hypothetical protein